MWPVTMKPPNGKLRNLDFILRQWGPPALNVMAQEGQREAAKLNKGEWVQDEGEAEGQLSLGGRVQHLKVLRSALRRRCEEETCGTYHIRGWAQGSVHVPQGQSRAGQRAGRAGRPRPPWCPVTALGPPLASFQTRGGRAQPSADVGSAP